MKKLVTEVSYDYVYRSFLVVYFEGGGGIHKWIKLLTEIYSLATMDQSVNVF